MPRAFQTKVLINPCFGQVGEKGPDDGIAPDQSDLSPGDRCDQAKTIGGQESSHQLGADRRPDHDRCRMGLLMDESLAAGNK